MNLLKTRYEFWKTCYLRVRDEDEIRTCVYKIIVLTLLKPDVEEFEKKLTNWKVMTAIRTKFDLTRIPSGRLGPKVKKRVLDANDGEKRSRSCWKLSAKSFYGQSTSTSYPKNVNALTRLRSERARSTFVTLRSLAGTWV